MEVGRLRLIGIIVGVIAFLWFLLPFIVAGILNIGNATGMIVSALLVIYSVFSVAIHMWLKKNARWLLVACGVAVAGIAVIAMVETGCIVNGNMKKPQEDATAVVLGCRVYGERASLSLVERLEAAYKYLEENPKARCVVSGGQGPGEDISEAECMYRWLVAKGIDGARIYKEDKSTSTEENIAF